MVTWNLSDVDSPGTRPGARLNFITEAQNLISGGLTGVVAATVRAKWGPANEAVRVESINDFVRIFTTNYNRDGFDAYQIALNIFSGGAKSLIVYRVDTAGVKSTYTFEDTTSGGAIDALKLTAKYPGEIGNNIEIKITANATLSNRKDVNLVMTDDRGIEIANLTWTTPAANGSGASISGLVGEINNDQNNLYIVAEELNNVGSTPNNDTLAEVTTAVSLASGTDGSAIASTQYVAAQDALSQENFEIVYFNFEPVDAAGAATTMGTAVETWVTSERDRGKKIAWYTGGLFAATAAASQAGAKSFDNEGVVFVSTGARILDINGVELRTSPRFFAARVAGLVAGLNLNQSPTFASIPGGIVDLYTKHKHSEIVNLLRDGALPIVYDGARFKIERGINTFTSFTSDKGPIFGKIQELRILDNINNVIKSTVDRFVIGKSPNSVRGRKQTLGIIGRFLDRQAFDGFIETDYVIRQDPNIESSGNNFFVQIGIKPIGVIEFMWFTINVT